MQKFWIQNSINDIGVARSDITFDGEVMKVLMKNFHGLERTSCTPMKSSTYIMNDTPTNPVLLRKLDQYARCFIFFFSFFLFFYFVKANSSLSNIHSDKTYQIALLGPYTEQIRSLFSLINSSSIHLFSPIPLSRTR